MGKMKHEPYNKFKGIMREKGLTNVDIAKTLGLSETAISMKTNGASDYYISEVMQLEKEYGIGFKFFCPDGFEYET